ncbi:hypothetical protein Asch01_01891 [Acinetobacter schindleri]|uniref:hypothetical protein n=1 Tax=Acinetobacter schindleri TaxID=108981 RepID=UPI003096F8B6
MKERPILFNAEMVQAILDGRKTQTRRIMRRQPDAVERFHHGESTKDTNADHAILRCYSDPKGFKGCNSGWLASATYKTPFSEFNVGDRLWVRETFCYGCIDEWDAEHPDDRRLFVDQYDGRKQSSIPKQWCLENNVEIEDVIWKPSIHMPRSASRLLLEITKIRVEQIQDITKEDAKAEGFDYSTTPSAIEMGYSIGARTNFRHTWEGIYGTESWDQNPWVWVIEFKVVQGGAA